MKRRILIFFAVIFSFIAATAVSAHEPHYVKDSRLIVIKNPDISQAFYGELKGWPAYYLINLKTAQDLFLQILVPDLPEASRDKEVTVEYAEELGQKAISFAQLDPTEVPWQAYYEEYAGDHYLAGPSLTKPGEPGYYIIKVSSPDNSGKYVLAVGEKEELLPAEMIKALITIPQLKKDFFQEPLKGWFSGKVGKYFIVGLLIVLVVGFLFHRFRRVYK